MIEALYAVNFLKGHLQRFKKYNRINATIDCGDNYVSFYAKDDNSSKQYLARGSDHQLRMQHLADKDEPWKGDNISIVFITPKSPQDVRIRQRVMQNHYGGIKPFDVTTYQYDNSILDERDLSQIFRSIMTFLNGGSYNDPFKGTPKAAKVIPRTSDIKPYKEPTRKARNISVDKDGNHVSANAWGADYVSENKDIKLHTNMNKKQIRLTESDLHRIVKRSVNKVLREGINDITPLSTHIQNNQDADLETLGNIVDDLRKVKEGGALSKWNPTIAARLKKSGLVDTETVQAITQISLLIYRLGNMDFSHKRVYNGETFDDTWNRLQHEQD